jgi:DNA repair protein RadC
MKSKQQRVLEHIQMCGIAGIADEDLLAFVLGRKGTEDERWRMLERVKALVQEVGVSGLLNGDIDGMLTNEEVDHALLARLFAVLELGRRLAAYVPKKGRQVKDANDAAECVRDEMRFLDHEEMRVMILDTKNYVVDIVPLYKGTVNSSVLRAAEIFRQALLRQCCHVILFHNHPSTDPEPSPEDIQVTKQLVKAAELLDIELLDHIIIGNPRYVSLKERLRWE